MIDLPLVGETTTVGELRCTPLRDGHLRVPPTLFFPGTTDGDWALGAHRQWLDPDGLLTLPIAAVLVEAPGRTVLIDTGLGFNPLEGLDSEGGHLTEALAGIGVSPVAVDIVLLTHLHGDHVGGTVADGGAAFPNATYRCHADDLAWQPGVFPDTYLAQIEPVLDRIDPVADGMTIAPGVTVREAPGHTPGHLVVTLSSGGERAVLLGDAVHCPAQLDATDWAMIGDADPALASRTREALLREIDSETLVGAAHFPGLRFGRLVTGGAARTWVPLS